MTVSVLCLFVTVPLVGLQCAIMAFSDHTHLLFDVSEDADQFRPISPLNR